MKALIEALVAFQAEMKPVAKGASNPFFKSKYATLDAILEQAQPLLAKHGLAISQFPSNVNGTPALTTHLLHTSGEMLSDTMVLCEAKMDPQGQGAAITYARRYAVAGVLGITTDEDDDGEAAMGRPSTRLNNAARSGRDDTGRAAPSDRPGSAPSRTPARSADDRTKYDWINGGACPEHDDTANAPSPKQQGLLAATCAEHGVERDAVKRALGIQSANDMDWKQFQWVLRAVMDGWDPADGLNGRHVERADQEPEYGAGDAYDERPF